MTDPPSPPRDVAARLERQAQACAAMGSSFTATLLREAAADYRNGGAVRALLGAHPGFARPGLHLAGTIHYLALAGDATLAQHYPSVGGDGDARTAWAAAREALASDPARIEELFTRIPQTNEPARAMPLLAAFAWLSAQLGMPLRILEAGASAGLNLRFDRYGYDGGEWRWGDASSPLVLRNRVTAGRPAHLDVPICVGERLGCDLHPLDASREEDRLRLTSFVWPDQRERLDRLRRALAVAADVPVRIDAESFATWLARVGAPRSGVATVIVHTLIEEHLAPADRVELAATIAAHGRSAFEEAPLARVRMELLDGSYATLVRLWPGPETSILICTSDGHAQDIRWNAPRDNR